MNDLYPPNQYEHTNFQNFELIYKGIKRKGIYLLEYQDAYLKDAFVTQLAEQFINKGGDALFIQEEKLQYSIETSFSPALHSNKIHTISLHCHKSQKIA